MVYYFAYGSNLHHLQMKKRCPKCHYIKRIILVNFQLTFRNKGGWADIEKKIIRKFLEVYTQFRNLQKIDWISMKIIQLFIKKCILNTKIKK